MSEAALSLSLCGTGLFYICLRKNVITVLKQDCSPDFVEQQTQVEITGSGNIQFALKILLIGGKLVRFVTTWVEFLSLQALAISVLITHQSKCCNIGEQQNNPKMYMLNRGTQALIGSNMV